MVIKIRANGDIEFPDGEKLDVWPEHHPEPAHIRRHTLYQILKAVQDGLPEAH
jgi:hypothetical protein